MGCKALLYLQYKDSFGIPVIICREFSNRRFFHQDFARARMALTLAQRAFAAAEIFASAAGLNRLGLFDLRAFRAGFEGAGSWISAGFSGLSATGADAVADAGEATSIPNTSAISFSLIAGAPSGPVVWRTASAAEALLTKSAGSTPRSKNSSAGF
jgi:hypothetical protein